MDAPSSHEHAIQQNFITGETNVVHLFSSMEILLKVPGYTVFFDANVYPSLQDYIKDRSLETLDTGLLFKEKLGLSLLQKILGRYPNLVILPTVAEEIDHMAGSDLTQVRRKREHYERLTTAGMNTCLDIHNRLTELGGLITAIRQAFKDKAQAAQTPIPEVYSPILSLVKFLDGHLGSKKPESRESNDTDERLVAAAFYQMFHENRNTAIYTRDEDVKRLVSTTFRIIRHLAATRKPNALSARFDFTNIIVFKYHYEKNVFSRFFESQTTARPEEYIFPSRLRDQEKSSILNGAQELVQEIERQIGVTAQASLPEAPEKPSAPGGQKALRHIASLILDEGRFPPAEGEEQERENDLEHLLVLARFFDARDVVTQVEASLEELHQMRMEARIRWLEARNLEVEVELKRLIAPGGEGIGLNTSQRMARLIAEVNDNLLERLFMATAIEDRQLTLGGTELERLRKALRALEQGGHDIFREKVCLPLEEIASLVGISVDRVVHLVQTRKIQHEGRQVFLEPKDLVRLFLSVSNKA